MNAIEQIAEQTLSTGGRLEKTSENALDYIANNPRKLLMWESRGLLHLAPGRELALWHGKTPADLAKLKSIFHTLPEPLLETPAGQILQMLGEPGQQWQPEKWQSFQLGTVGMCFSGCCLVYESERELYTIRPLTESDAGSLH